MNVLAMFKKPLFEGKFRLFTRISRENEQHFIVIYLLQCLLTVTFDTRNSRLTSKTDL